MNILSIQSHVAYGHAGNASAVFPMQRLGHEVWPVNTVQFSNHTGYGAWKGQVFSAAAVREVIEGIAERGVLPGCDAVLSGYMGDAAIGEVVLEAVQAVKAANPAALYCCDPVMGDVGRGIFVRPDIPAFFKSRVVAAADILTPNHFELELLSGADATTPAAIADALDMVHALGPSVILVTSLMATDTPDDAVDMLVSDSSGRFRIRTPRLPIAVNGAGDAAASLFLVHYLASRRADLALAQMAASIYGVLHRTAEAGSREILTIAAQDEIVMPSQTFAVVPFPNGGT